MRAIFVYVDPLNNLIAHQNHKNWIYDVTKWADKSFFYSIATESFLFPKIFIAIVCAREEIVVCVYRCTHLLRGEMETGWMRGTERRKRFIVIIMIFNIIFELCHFSIRCFFYSYARKKIVYTNFYDDAMVKIYPFYRFIDLLLNCWWIVAVFFYTTSTRWLYNEIERSYSRE